MPVITVPKVLREKLGEDGADSIIELINLATQQVKEDVIALSAEKFEKRLTDEVTKIDKRITDESAKLDKRITEEISRLKTEDLAKLDKSITDEVAKLRVEISQTRADIIKWMFIFWAGQIFALLGILLAFFK